MFRLLSICAALWAGPALACTVDTSEAAGVITATNAYRATQGRPALRSDADLVRAAQRHACELAATQRFSHEGQNGSRVGDRVTRAGYRWRYVAENLAIGQSSVGAVMTAWRQSSAHHSNLLTRRGRDIGVAAVPSSQGMLWVMVLGAPR
ncbi:MAG: CAP domain-containing protein [Pseudomonadota bacterium]